MSAVRKLCWLHVAANALLLWLGYEWLGVGESTGLRLVWSALDALAILALACWLWGATLVFFRPPGARLEESFRTALRHVPALLAAAIAVAAVYAVLATPLAQSAYRFAGYLTLQLHKPVKPAAVLRVFHAALWVVRWVVLPVGLLPMASEIAARGWRGFAAVTWRASWLFWLRVPATLVVGLALPFVLLGWAPRGGFGVELASFALRGLCAYLLFVGATLALAGMGSHGHTSGAAR